MKVVMYTDGGSDPNPGIGGWAALLRAGGREKIITGSEPHTTNNRMELQAAIGGLQALTRSTEVEIHTDSAYLQKGITEWIESWEANQWRRKGKPIPNADLWQQLWRLVQQHSVEWHWVKGHSGNALNERVDYLARQARLAITPRIDNRSDVLRVYIRSSCKGNPGPGGWGVILEEEDETEQNSGSMAQTTNNRMELTAAIEAFRMAPTDRFIQIFTTSDYVFQGATKWIHGWRRREWKKRDGKPVSNIDLWQELDRLMAQFETQWVNAKGKEMKEVQGLKEAGLLALSAVESEL